MLAVNEPWQPCSPVWMVPESVAILERRSNMKESNNGSGKYGILTILGIIFIVLKLCKVITWSWMWVLCPFWIELFMVVGLIIFIKWLTK